MVLPDRRAAGRRTPLRWASVVLGVVGSLLVCAGGMIDSMLPGRSGWSGIDWLYRLRCSHTAHLQAWQLMALGLLLMTLGWLLLRFACSATPSDLLRASLVFAGTTLLPILVVPPLFSTDAWLYVGHALMTRHGISPYLHYPAEVRGQFDDVVPSMWQHTLSAYGPLALGWGALVAVATSSVYLLFLTYRLLAVGALIVLAVAVPRLARRAGVDPGRAIWLTCASPLVLMHGVGGTHLDLAVGAAGAAALCVTRRDVWVWGAILAGTAASIKLPGGLVGVGVVMLSLSPSAALGRRMLRAISVAFVSGLTLVLSGLIAGLGLGWVQALFQNSQRSHNPLAVPQQLGTILSHLTNNTVSRTEVAHWFVAIGGAALLVLALVLMLSRPSRSLPSLRATALLLAAATLLTPVLQPWYILGWLPLAACAPLPRPVSRAVTALVALAGATCAASPGFGPPHHVLAVVVNVALFVVPLAVVAVSAVRAMRARSAPAIAAD